MLNAFGHLAKWWWITGIEWCSTRLDWHQTFDPTLHYATVCLLSGVNNNVEWNVECLAACLTMLIKCMCRKHLFSVIQRHPASFIVRPNAFDKFNSTMLNGVHVVLRWRVHLATSFIVVQQSFIQHCGVILNLFDQSLTVKCYQSTNVILQAQLFKARLS